MSKKDTSREESLYHLLLVLARIHNANPATKKHGVSEALRSLKVEKSDTSYSVEIEFQHTKRSASRPVTEFKFYDTKSDPTVSERNKDNALILLKELLPEAFEAVVASKHRVKKAVFSETITALYLVLSMISLLTNNRLLASIALSIGSVTLPMWIFLVNSTFAQRVTISIVGSLTFCLGNQTSELNSKIVATLIVIGATLVSRKYHSRSRNAILMALLFVLLVIAFQSGIGNFGLFLACILVFVNLSSRIFFRISKSIGMTWLALLSMVSLFVILMQSKIDLTERILTFSISSAWFAFVLYVFTVSGFLIGPTKLLAPIFCAFLSYDFNYSYALAPLILSTFFLKTKNYVNNRGLKGGA